MIMTQTTYKNSTTIAVTASTFVLSFLWYIGVFKKIQFRKETLAPFTLIYRTNKGPYHEVGTLFNETIKYMNYNGFEHCNTAGLYYDNPELVRNPRYAVGFIIIENDKKHEEKLNKMRDCMEKEWKILEVKETEVIASYFPLRFTILSCTLSAIKTYAAFKSYNKRKGKCTMMDEGIGSLEIYYKDRIGTYFPQSNFMQFKADTD